MHPRLQNEQFASLHLYQKQSFFYPISLSTKIATSNPIFSTIIILTLFSKIPILASNLASKRAISAFVAFRSSLKSTISDAIASAFFCLILRLPSGVILRWRLLAFGHYTTVKRGSREKYPTSDSQWITRQSTLLSSLTLVSSAHRAATPSAQGREQWSPHQPNEG